MGFNEQVDCGGPFWSTLSLDFEGGGGGEGEVLGVGDVAELVGEAAGGADGCLDVAVRVSVDPVVDARGDDVVAKFDGEGAVDGASLKVF